MTLVGGHDVRVGERFEQTRGRVRDALAVAMGAPAEFGMCVVGGVSVFDEYPDGLVEVAERGQSADAAGIAPGHR